MTAPEIFKELLKDPLLIDKYQLTVEKLQKTSLHEPSSSDILELLKLVVNGIENNLPERSVNSQVKTRFKI